MRLVIVDDYTQLSEWAAKYVRNKILKFNPGPDKYFVLGLPTGTDFRRNNIFVVVNFLSQVMFLFLLFQLHWHTGTLPYPKMKEKQKLLEMKNQLYHLSIFY